MILNVIAIMLCLTNSVLIVFNIINLIKDTKFLVSDLRKNTTTKRIIELDPDLIQKALDYLSENGIEGDITYDSSDKWIYLNNNDKISFTYIIKLSPELFGYGKKWQHIKDELDSFIKNVLPKLKEIDEKNDKD